MWAGRKLNSVRSRTGGVQLVWLVEELAEREDFAVGWGGGVLSGVKGHSSSALFNSKENVLI